MLRIHQSHEVHYLVMESDEGVVARHFANQFAFWVTSDLSTAKLFVSHVQVQAFELHSMME